MLITYELLKFFWHDMKRQEDKKPLNMNRREEGSFTQGVYPTQDTSRMGTARVEQEKEADTRIISEEENKIWKK